MDINRYVPKFRIRQSNLLNLTDLTAEEIFEFLYAAREMKKRFRVGENYPALRGKTVALLFGNASTRTRITFEMGIRQLGGDYLFLPKGETQLSRGESIKDTAVMLGRYGISAVVLRAFTEAQVHEFAQYSTVPVLNGISEASHPLQVLSDLFTVWEKKGRLDNLKLAYIGDGITDDVAEAVKGADIVYTDVFISMSEEDDEQKKRTLARYRVTPEVMALAKEDAVFMHCMPVRRGEEVSAEVIDGPRSIVYDQAENRLHLNKAALALLVR